MKVSDWGGWVGRERYHYIAGYTEVWESRISYKTVLEKVAMWKGKGLNHPAELPH